MNTINGGGFNMDPAQAMQKIQDRFNSSDSDGNGSISKTEMLAGAPEGADSSRMEKRFDRLDTNGDGEISAEEQQAMIDKMKERMANIRSRVGSGITEGIDTFNNLLDLLAESAKGDDSDFIEQLKSKLEGENLSDQELSQSIMEFSIRYPSIDTSA